MKNNPRTSIIIAILAGISFLSPIIGKSSDTYMKLIYGGNRFYLPTKALCILEDEDRKFIASNIHIPHMLGDSTGHILERAVILRDVLGWNRTPGEQFLMEVAGTWRTCFRCAVLDESIIYNPVEFNSNVRQYIKDIEDDLLPPVESILRKAEIQKRKDKINFTPYEDNSFVTPPIFDDGTFCTSLLESEPNFNDIVENDGSCSIPDDEPDFSGIPENDGSFEQINTKERVTLSTGQVLVQVKYHGRTKYVLLDENYVGEDTTLPTIIGDLERNLLHLGVNVTSDRLQRMMLFRLDFLQGKTTSEIADSYSVPYHIVHSDLQVIRKIKWPDGLVI